MAILTAMILVTVAAVVVSLAEGIGAMACDARVGGANSAQWMGRRVLFHAIALIMLLMALTS